MYSKWVGHESIIISKSSHIKKFLNKALIEIVNRGHLDRFIQKWQVKKQDCGIEKNANPLGIKKLSMLFIILATGLAFGLIVFIVEMLTKSCFQKEAKKIKDHEIDDLSANEIKTMVNYICKKDEMFSIEVRHYIKAIQETREPR